MIRFREPSLEELSEKFPQMPNRKLTMVNSLEDMQEAQELLVQIRKQRHNILEQAKASKR